MCDGTERTRQLHTRYARNEWETYTYTHMSWTETSSQIFDLILMKIASIPMSKCERVSVASMRTDSISFDSPLLLWVFISVFAVVLLALSISLTLALSHSRYLSTSFTLFLSPSRSPCLQLIFVLRSCSSLHSRSRSFNHSILLLAHSFTVSRSHWRWQHTDNWRTSKDMNKTMKN